MILTPDDRRRLFDAFVDRVGPTALPASTTIDDLCRNLVLAIPALLETCEAQAAEIATLTARLEADPCP